MITNPCHSRSFYAFLNIVFNRVSKSRIQEVGPDRACAEWLMRNGAFIRWKGYPSFVKHYDGLPLDPNDTFPYLIEEIDATDASISHHGFAHFKGCKNIDKIKFNTCWYIDDEALRKLEFVQESLKTLEILKCEEVTLKGLSHLKSLKNLEFLKLADLTSVDDMNKSISELTQALPKCSIMSS